MYCKIKLTARVLDWETRDFRLNRDSLAVLLNLLNRDGPAWMRPFQTAGASTSSNSHLSCPFKMWEGSILLPVFPPSFLCNEEQVLHLLSGLKVYTKPLCLWFQMSFLCLFRTVTFALELLPLCPQGINSRATCSTARRRISGAPEQDHLSATG